MLTACAHGTKQIPAIKINPPEAAMTPCKDLSVLVGKVGLQDLIADHIETAAKYQECSAKHKTLVDFLEQK